jgi:hypothetical protein
MIEMRECNGTSYSLCYCWTMKEHSLIPSKIVEAPAPILYQNHRLCCMGGKLLSLTLTLQCRIPYLTREAFKSHAAVLRI